MSLRRVLFVAPECAPYARTGGLGDVLGALPAALSEQGIEPYVVIPLVGDVNRKGLERTPAQLRVPLASGHAEVAVWRAKEATGATVWFLEHEPLFGRKGIYGPNGRAFPDNLARFSLLARGALELCKSQAWIPDVVHAHDWPGALAPVMLHTLGSGPLARTASVLTIHNVGYQGAFPLGDFAVTALPASELTPSSLEHFGSLNLLKGGILRSTQLSTVSATYAREIQTPAFGCGLDGVVRQRAADLCGILNGIDTRVWNPEIDPLLPAHFSSRELRGKSACKAELQSRAGLPVREQVPLFGVVTRLTHQKGMDVLAHALGEILALDLQVVLVGTGDAAAERFFAMASRERPDRFRAWIGFDDALAHLVEAGADFFVMPSRYEPCGLNQMYSLRYGTLPIVRATGGLADTVVNYDERTGGGTGFRLDDLNPRSLFNTIGWAVSTWFDRPRHVQAMRERGMKIDFSWNAAARAYRELYERAVEAHRQ